MIRFRFNLERLVELWRKGQQSRKTNCQAAGIVKGRVLMA